MYQIAESEAVVGVDRPMKAISMHIQSCIKENCLNFHSCNFVNLFLTKLLHAIVQRVYIVKAKYCTAPSKAVVGVDQPIKHFLSVYTKALLGKNFLSSQSCHFVKKKH